MEAGFTLNPGFTVTCSQCSSIHLNIRLTEQGKEILYCFTITDVFHLSLYLLLSVSES